MFEVVGRIDWFPLRQSTGIGQHADAEALRLAPFALRLASSDDERLVLRTAMADRFAKLVVDGYCLNRLYQMPDDKIVHVTRRQIESVAGQGAKAAEDSLEARHEGLRAVHRYERKISNAFGEVSPPASVVESGRFVVDLGLVLQEPAIWPLGIRVNPDGDFRHVLLDSHGRPTAFPEGDARRFISGALTAATAQSYDSVVAPLESMKWAQGVGVDLREELHLYDDDGALFVPAIRKALAEFR